MNFEENQIISSYRLLKCCGSGAYGQVFIAENMLTQHKTALKIITGNDSVMARELRGLINYRNCRHENLLQIHHIDKIDGTLFYTMDLADNLNTSMENYLPDTLSNRLSYYNHLPPQVVMQMANDLLSGIKKLHSCGIIHRDIKPDNILWVNGKAVLGDIGLITCNRANSLIGTPDFMSPALLARKRAANEADDFFSLSRVLYCAMTGFTPDRFPQLPPGLLQKHGASEAWKIIISLDQNSSYVTSEAIIPHSIDKSESKKWSTLRTYIVSLMILSMLMVLPGFIILTILNPTVAFCFFWTMFLIFFVSYFWNSILIKRTFLKILSFFLGAVILLLAIPVAHIVCHAYKRESLQQELLPDHPECTVKDVIRNNFDKAKWQIKDDQIVIFGKKSTEPDKGKQLIIEFYLNEDGSIDWDHPVNNDRFGKNTREVVYTLAGKNPVPDTPTEIPNNEMR
jgi:serine/threonine protein kinase